MICLKNQKECQYKTCIVLYANLIHTLGLSTLAKMLFIWADFLSSSMLNKCRRFVKFLQILFRWDNLQRCHRQNLPWGKNWTKPITKQKCVFLVYNYVVKPLFFSFTKASVVTFNGHSQVKGGSLNWKSKGIQRDSYNWNSEGMGGGGRGELRSRISTGDRQECMYSLKMLILWI